MKPEPTSPLDNLAGQADAAMAAAPQGMGVPGQGAADDQAEAAEQMARIEAGAVKVLIGLGRALRALLCRKLPELADEWSDEMLRGPAEAAIPLLRKHLQRLMTMVGDNPDLAVFAFSLIPLVTGYMAALDRHEKAAAAAQTEPSGSGEVPA